MNKIIFFGTFACLFVLPISAKASVAITEVFANPDDEDRHEMIELYNDGEASIDLAGFTLTDGDALDTLVAWSEVDWGEIKDLDAVTGTTILPSKTAALILDQEYAGGDQIFDVPSGVVMLTTENTTLGNGLTTTDPMTLYDASGIVVSTYGTPIAAPDWQSRDDDGLDAIPLNPGDKISVERNDSKAVDVESSWQVSKEDAGHSAGFLSSAVDEPSEEEGDEDPEDRQPTPPTPPTPPDPGTCSDLVKINEALPNPVGGDTDGEFIELMYSGSAALSLERWKLTDGSTTDVFGAVTMAPTSLLSLPRSSTKIALNNSGEETLQLICATGKEVDRVTIIGPALEGQAWVRDSGGVWTTTPTPGKSNLLTLPNDPPKADFEITGEREVGATLIFDATDSSDPDGLTLHFEWEFGDGQSGEGSMVKHRYAKAGSFTVSLTVSDGKLEDQKTQTFSIASPVVPSSSKGKSEQPAATKKKSKDATPSSSAPVIKKTTSRDVYLTEIFPNPDGPDEEGEWIEITNFDKSAINLEGWMLKDEKTSFTIGRITLQMNGRAMLKREDSRITLNNSGDALYLIDGFGKIVNGVSYDKAPLGESFARDGRSEAWSWTSTPTPEAENIISEEEEDIEDEEGENEPVVLTANSYSEKATSSESKKTIAPIAVSLTELQMRSKGTLVEVTGTVSAIPGERGTQKMFITDGENETQIYSYYKSFPELEVGDEVAVKGMVSEAGGEKRVNIKTASDIQITKHAPVTTSVVDSVEEEQGGGESAAAAKETKDQNAGSVLGASTEALSLPPSPSSAWMWWIAGLGALNFLAWVIIIRFDLAPKLTGRFRSWKES